MVSVPVPSFAVGSTSSAADGLPETEKNSGESENTYILRPIFQQRFRPSVVKDCIHAVLKEELANVEYSPEEMPQLTKHLSENIKDKLKEMGFDRYKMVVQVVIGEQRGEGVFLITIDFNWSTQLWSTIQQKVSSTKLRKALLTCSISHSTFSTNLFLCFSMAARCFWDADTDNYTHDIFMNDSLFCVVAAFGCFYY